MKLKLLLIIGLMHLLLGFINAQDFKLAGISFLNYPYSGLKDEVGNAKFSFREYGASINIPYKTKNSKTIVINSLGYALVSITGKGLGGDSTQFKEQLHAMYYQIMLAHKLKNNWRLVTSIRPTIASDVGENLKSEDFVLQGAAFVSKKVNEYFGIGGGLAYTTRFGKPFAVPVMPLRYKKDKHSISALIPIKLIYIYCLGKKDKLNIGIKQTINGAQFNITTLNTEQYNVSHIYKIRYTRINFGAILNFSLTKFIQLEVNGGVSIRRRYSLLDSSGNKNQFDLKKTPYFQFGIVLVPPKKKINN